MSWVPKTDFEKEVLSVQLDHNFVFGKLASTEDNKFVTRPKAHLEYATQKREQRKICEINPKLNIISEIQAIAGTKPPGELPSASDWDTYDNLERETVAMMRHFGLGPSVEHKLNENCSFATYPLLNGLNVSKQGDKRRMPILYDEKYFDFENENEHESLAMDEDVELEKVDWNGDKKNTAMEECTITFLRDKNDEIKHFKRTEKKYDFGNTIYSKDIKGKSNKLVNHEKQHFMNDLEYIPTLNFYNSKSSLYDSLTDQSSVFRNSRSSNDNAHHLRRFYSPTEIYKMKHNKK